MAEGSLMALVAPDFVQGDVNAWGHAWWGDPLDNPVESAIAQLHFVSYPVPDQPC